ncbi:alpha/beta fold hydrolase [Haloimpatiens myeolchijeotgali]|uniref:alpha/beta fold hydrolase n=1 Tax=Haloimpatiens sp. FM7330 TaxID=3298610 RepID=UPI00384B160D
MIQYNVAGNVKGDVVVFINGAGVGPWMWNNQVKHFTSKKCITFDLPGHGLNSDIDFTTIEDCAILIKKIILKESKSKKAILIGHSIGAQIIMFMLEHYEDVIDKAIIISGLNKPMPFVNAMVKPMIACTMPLVKLKIFAKVQSKQLSIPDSMFDDYYKDSLKISKETFSHILYENSNYSFQNKSRVKVDTLILVGENEKKIMKESANKNKALLENSIGYIVKNASHGIPYEQSDLLNYAVDCFINSKEIVDKNLIVLK